MDEVSRAAQLPGLEEYCTRVRWRATSAGNRLFSCVDFRSDNEENDEGANDESGNAVCCILADCVSRLRCVSLQCRETFLHCCGENNGSVVAPAKRSWPQQ